MLPGVAAAKALRARGHLVHFLVKQDGRSPEYLAREGFPSTAFHFEGFPRGLNPALFTYPLKLMTAEAVQTIVAAGIAEGVEAVEFAAGRGGVAD